MMKKNALLSALALIFCFATVGNSYEYTPHSKSPTEFTKTINVDAVKGLNFDDKRDFASASMGYISRDEKLLIKTDHIVWNMASYDFISERPAPDSVNPSLWRHAQLNGIYGLFEVVKKDFGGSSRSIYQVRGYDLANITFVEADNSFIVVDVLTTEETAAAAIKLFYNSIPQEKRVKPISTVIYTHSHIDHFGGIYGVLRSGHVENCKIIAPTGFTEAAVAENLTVGPAMKQRAKTMYGLLLTASGYIGERGHIDNGLGKNTAQGTTGLMPPHIVISKDFEKMNLDGLSVEFIMAQNTEAPAEMAFYFEDYLSICLAEVCNRTYHNILTPRGAVVRDPVAWSDALDKIVSNWGDRAESAWGPHTWPQLGGAEIKNYVRKQSLAYRYLHDQTVYFMNKGLGAVEIAEKLRLPPSLNFEWFNRGYYGTVNFNAKAVFQKYLGWFDNNPATLWKLPPTESAKFYVKYLPAAGGDMLKAAQAAFDDGNYRWVVEVLEHLRLASQDKNALYLQADAFEQLAYVSESGIWRNYFLTGALRNRNPKVAAALAAPVVEANGAETIQNFDTMQILTMLSTQIDGSLESAVTDRKILWEIDGGYFETTLECSVLWSKQTDKNTADNAKSAAKVVAPREIINEALKTNTNWLSALAQMPSVQFENGAKAEVEAISKLIE